MCHTPPLRPRPGNFGQLPDRLLPTSSPKSENDVSYEAGLAENCHQMVPARGGVNRGPNWLLESLEYTQG